MTRSRPFESRLLTSIEKELELALAKTTGPSARLDILEAASAALAGYGASDLRRRSPADWCMSANEASARATRVVEAIRAVDVPHPFVLAALAQPALDAIDRRQSGAYYTDFRLAQYAAKQLALEMPDLGIILDPACGSGMLLAAAAVETIATRRISPAEVIANHIAGVDLSPIALRSATLVLASLAGDPDAVLGLRSRLRQADSLTAGSDLWSSLAPDGIQAVIANPPWEKLKLSRHEMLQKAGVDRHYGEVYSPEQEGSVDVEGERGRLGSYVHGLGPAFQHQGSGEADLYKLFTELALSLVTGAGAVSLIVPAGLLRAQGAEELRRLLFRRADRIQVTIIHNRAGFFAIDSRFKFLVLSCRLGREVADPLELHHGVGTDSGLAIAGTAQIDRNELERIRPDMTIPEVRNQNEWALFRRLVTTGVRLDDAGRWGMDIIRELDMTNDAGSFRREQVGDGLPVVEGRMVHQYHFPAKRYLGGTGRKAIWRVQPSGARAVVPQFWVSPGDLSESVRQRTSLTRLGFCDITGQTNERSMLACLVPPGVVCGNKVPTVVLKTQGSEAVVARGLWLAVANSFVFDWLLRRVVTTSVNYFVLRSLAFPPLWVDDLRGLRIARRALTLANGEVSDPSTDPWVTGLARAAIDAEVAVAWGVSPSDFELILDDFPLLDRGQPPAPGEERSTVTRDVAMCTYLELTDPESTRLAHVRSRVMVERASGAVPYVPSEHVAVQSRGHELRESSV